MLADRRLSTTILSDLKDADLYIVNGEMLPEHVFSIALRISLSYQTVYTDKQGNVLAIANSKQSHSES